MIEDILVTTIPDDITVLEVKLKDKVMGRIKAYAAGYRIDGPDMKFYDLGQAISKLTGVEFSPSPRCNDDHTQPFAIPA